jgi:hypothetical protein
VNELLANIVEAHGGFDRWRRPLGHEEPDGGPGPAPDERLAPRGGFFRGTARPVFMLRVVSRLVRPEFLVVIEIVAAKA